jgi:hypothetical protein
MRRLPGALALLLSTTGLAAQAQAIYRCGDTYSQQPCAGGQQVAQPPPAPSPADRAQAGANARRDAAMAATLEKDRLRQDSQSGSQPLYIPAPSTEPARDEYKTPEKKATRKLDVFTATAPGSATKKDKKDKPKAAAKATSKTEGKAKVAKASAPAIPRVLPVANPAKAGGSS